MATTHPSTILGAECVNAAQILKRQNGIDMADAALLFVIAGRHSQTSWQIWEVSQNQRKNIPSIESTMMVLTSQAIASGPHLGNKIHDSSFVNVVIDSQERQCIYVQIMGKDNA